MFGHQELKNLLLVTSLVLMCCGCDTHREYQQIAEQTEHGNDYTKCLYMEYDELKGYGKEISNFERSYIDISKPSAGISVELGYKSIANSSDTFAVEINESGVKKSDKEMSFSIYKLYPADTVTRMAGVNTVDELWNKFGQPYIYTEQGNVSAMLFKDTLLYGTEGDYKTVPIDEQIDTLCVESMQITSDYVYLFETANATSGSMVLAEIPLNGEADVRYISIPFSDMGLPRGKHLILEDNTFIDKDILYFAIDSLSDSNVWIAAYDLKNNRGTNIEVSTDYCGKLFCYKDCIGLMVCGRSKGDTYSADMGIHFYEFNAEKCALTENAEMQIEFPKSAKYIYNLEGYNFYCIEDKLCGIMYNHVDYTRAYVEIDLDSGIISSFIPISNKMKYHGLVGYTVKYNGIAVSQHNCDL